MAGIDNQVMAKCAVTGKQIPFKDGCIEYVYATGKWRFSSMCSEEIKEEDESYWIPIERIRTTPTFLAALLHISGKVWFKKTEFIDFLISFSSENDIAIW